MVKGSFFNKDWMPRYLTVVFVDLKSLRTEDVMSAKRKEEKENTGNF